MQSHADYHERFEHDEPDLKRAQLSYVQYILFPTPRLDGTSQNCGVKSWGDSFHPEMYWARPKERVVQNGELSM